MRADARNIFRRWFEFSSVPANNSKLTDEQVSGFSCWARFPHFPGFSLVKISRFSSLAQCNSWIKFSFPMFAFVIPQRIMIETMHFINNFVDILHNIPMTKTNKAFRLKSLKSLLNQLSCPLSYVNKHSLDLESITERQFRR